MKVKVECSKRGASWKSFKRRFSSCSWWHSHLFDFSWYLCTFLSVSYASTDVISSHRPAHSCALLVQNRAFISSLSLLNTSRLFRVFMRHSAKRWRKPTKIKSNKIFFIFLKVCQLDSNCCSFQFIFCSAPFLRKSFKFERPPNSELMEQSPRVFLHLKGELLKQVEVSSCLLFYSLSTKRRKKLCEVMDHFKKFCKRRETKSFFSICSKVIIFIFNGSLKSAWRATHRPMCRNIA